MSDTQIFYHREDVEEKVKEAKIIYFLLGTAIGALAMFGGLVAIGFIYGIQ